MDDFFRIFPVGVVRKRPESTSIEIYEAFQEALLGLDQFSHVIVCTWFHENDRPERRNVLRVHPKRDKNKPLTGVFATRSPVRPNLIALFTCKILSIKKNIIELDRIEAFDGSPVIDIKPYIPGNDAVPDARVAWWSGE
jgi:tRNA-Thr(GGU) m(6)t(6)A37 methyltransferase TsaA